ncbi:MAG: hypothetical protein KBC84_06805 [Proteobacteria bacterium]|nr:hypothetical protein [Pseudomonadota bacterium]
MDSQQQQINKSSGPTFHDIKSLPDFFPPFEIPWLYLLLTLIVLSLLYFLLRKKNKTNSKAMLNPYDTAVNNIRILEEKRQNNNIKLRDFSSSLSLELRLFIDNTLGTSTKEQTVNEISYTLKTLLLKRTNLVEVSLLDQFVNGNRTILKNLETVTYGKDSNERYTLNDKFIESLSVEVLNLVNALTAIVTKQNEITTEMEKKK